MSSITSEERSRLRRQLAEKAVKLAVSSRWDEAAEVNREFLRLFPEDVDALNRLGKALSELGAIADARQSYNRALELDPNNTIARRNLDRLSNMEDSAPADQPASRLDTSLFIEETGKAGVARLQAVDPKAAGKLDAGDLVELAVQGKAVNVLNTAGAYIGMLEPRIGLRLSRLIEGGNRYSAAVISVSDTEISLVLRETYQHSSLAGTVSFPQGRVTEVRAYTRRSLIREETDYTDGDDDDDGDSEDEETAEGWTTTDGEPDTQPDVDVEEDDEELS